jgi:hypothetical protein
VSNLADVIIWLSIAYALLGVLLLVICIFAKVPWPLKAGLIVLTSAFYVVSFFCDVRPARLVIDRSFAAEIQAPERPDRGTALARGRRRSDPFVGRGAR